MVQLFSVLSKFYDEYQNNTPKKLKLVDSYLIYVLLTGIIQFIYCCLVGTFPFNAFLSGFISTVSCFILGGKLRFDLFLMNLKFSLTRHDFLLFSLFTSSIKSTKQGTIFWNFTRKRIC